MKQVMSVDMDAYLSESDDVLSLKTKKGYITIRRADEVLHDFDESELAIIKSSLDKPEAYFVNYKDVSEVKSVLMQIANRSDVFIDTDTGILLTGKEFVKMCIVKPDWDWLLEF